MPRWVSFCPDGVSFCPEYHHQPLFFTQQSLNPFGDMYEHETPPAPPQNTPFPGLILKVGKMNYCLGKMDPIWAKCLKSGQNFSRSGQKKFIHAQEPKSRRHSLSHSQPFTSPCSKEVSLTNSFSLSWPRSHNLVALLTKPGFY